MLRLHIGCGDVYFEGWVNIDIESPRADVKHDLRSPLPYEADSVDFIYSEHFIEHLTVQDAVVALRDFHRVLRKGAVLRIATPSLDYLIFRYIFFWKKQDWIKEYGYGWLNTRAEMMNLCFREWGHQYLYNTQELKRRLREAGFLTIYRQKLNKSRFHELNDRETRKDSKLILEAIK